MLELRPASSLPLDRLAALFTAGYEDYYVQVRIDEPALAFMTRAFDIDLEASRIALRDSEPVGLCLLGLRGDEAWIGGLGVIVAARRSGVAEELMQAVLEEARGRGASKVWLEVIVENERARPLYERLGFERTRGLEVWTLQGAAGQPSEVPVEQAHTWIRAHRREREPWQRDDATLPRLEGLTGLAAAGGAAIVRVSDGRVAVQQIAGSDSATTELLAAARGLGDSLSILNLPQGDPVGVALESLGGQVAVRQHEMALDLP